MHFSIWKSRDDQFYFELKADNGETVAVSELYTRKESARETIESIKRGAGSAGIHDLTVGEKYNREMP
jgi:uncharacterized protein YegP (UPF0339 family)